MGDAILVTGGAGYIGSHTCKLLRQKSYLPVTLDNLVHGHESFVNWGPLVVGDIIDDVVLDRIFSKYAPAAVIHFAAYAYVNESVNDPGKYYRNNVSGTISLFEGMRRFNCRKIVFSSSCATYGIPETVSIDEDHAQSPINPYGRSKLMAEKILADYSRAYSFQHISLRYFNAAGASPEGDIGEKHSPETHLIPLAIQVALGEREHLEVFGTDYPTKDGTAVRDFIHVLDLASAHYKALELLHNDGAVHAINLGTGSGVSVMEAVRIVKEISGRKIPLVFGGRREGDPAMLVAGNKKAKRILGWEPTFSGIDQIVKTAWNYHATNV